MSLLLLFSGTPAPSYPNSSYYNAAHTAEGAALMLYQFHNSELAQALLAAFTDRVQALEDAVDPVPPSRDMTVISGDRLDGLGQIVGEPRGYRSDSLYKVYVRVRIAVNNSNGTAADLINIVQLVGYQDTADVWFDEYDPKTIYIRGRGFPDAHPDATAALLREAKPAGSRLVYMYSPSKTNDDLNFKFSSTISASETGVTKGFDSGVFVGAK